jgi:hypothetical protein
MGASDDDWFIWDQETDAQMHCDSSRSYRQAKRQQSVTLCKHFWERRCMRRISICLIVNQIFRCDPLNFCIISTMDRVFSQKKTMGRVLEIVASSDYISFQ